MQPGKEEQGKLPVKGLRSSVGFPGARVCGWEHLVAVWCWAEPCSACSKRCAVLGEPQ